MNLQAEAKKRLSEKIINDPETVAYMRTILTNSGVNWGKKDTAKKLAAKVYALMVKNSVDVEKAFVEHAGPEALAIQKQTGDFEKTLKAEWANLMNEKGVDLPDPKILGFDFGNVWNAIKDTGAEFLNYKAEKEGYDIDVRDIVNSNNPENETGKDKIKEAINEVYEAVKEREKSQEIKEMMPSIIGGVLVLIIITVLITKSV